MFTRSLKSKLHTPNITQNKDNKQRKKFRKRITFTAAIVR